MIRVLLFSIVIFLLIACTGCVKIPTNDTLRQQEQEPTESQNVNAIPEKTEYRKISAEEAKTMLDTNTDAILLDVRTDEEFKEMHIPGAILLPDYEIEDKAADLLPDKDALILIYCRSGNRSKIAANKLLSMGYTNVYDFGGIIDWSYDTESD